MLEKRLNFIQSKLIDAPEALSKVPANTEMEPTLLSSGDHVAVARGSFRTLAGQ